MHKRAKRYGTGRVSLFFFFLFIGAVFSSTALAEVLVPLHVEKGTNLIHIARKYCNKQADWPIIAKTNGLQDPYFIRENTTLQVPLSILRTKDVSAKVASVNGSPKVINIDEQVRELHKGDMVLPGQTVVTKKKEYVHLLYPDYKHTRIGPGSEMQLSYLLRLSDDTLQAEFLLKKGRITHSVAKKLKANEHFNTRTAIAITGIRGTEYRIKAGEDETNIVETLKGTVSLSAAGKQVMLTKGKGSTVKKDTPPEPPRKLPDPPNVSTLQDIYRVLPVVITAPSHNEAERIHLRVSEDVEGLTTLFEENAEPGKDFVLTGLMDGTYHAFFTAVDAAQFESIPTGPFTFTVRTVPAAPLISKPNDGLQTFDAKTTIQWMRSDIASSYYIQLAEDAGFSKLLHEEKLQENEFSTEELQPGNYFFRVKLIAKDGFETLFSPILTWEVVEQPQLGSLGELEKGEDGIVLRWPAIAKMSGYAIEIATDKQFENVVMADATLTKPSYTIREQLEPITHYVRIRAVMENGQKSPWTQPQELAVDPVPFGIVHTLLLIGFAAIIVL